MTKVEAIIQPFKVADAMQALLELGIAGMTLTEVRGFGRQGGHSEIYRGAEYIRDFLPKCALEIVVQDDAVEKVVAELVAVCRTGRIGDGLVSATPVEDAIRVRTGEAGAAAIEF